MLSDIRIYSCLLQNAITRAIFLPNFEHVQNLARTLISRCTIPRSCRHCAAARSLRSSNRTCVKKVIRIKGYVDENHEICAQYPESDQNEVETRERKLDNKDVQSTKVTSERRCNHNGNLSRSMLLATINVLQRVRTTITLTLLWYDKVYTRLTESTN